MECLQDAGGGAYSGPDPAQKGRISLAHYTRGPREVSPLGSDQLAVGDAMRLVGIGTFSFLQVLDIGLIIPFMPDDL